MADKLDPDLHDLKQPVAPSDAAVRSSPASRENENTTMLKVMGSRGPRAQSQSWAMTLCMGVGVVFLIVALAQLLR